MTFHHILSDLVFNFRKGPKSLFKKKWIDFLPREGLFRYAKIVFKNMKFGMGVP